MHDKLGRFTKGHPGYRKPGEYKHSGETKIKISLGIKKHLPRTIYKKGQVPWNYRGIKDKDTLERLRFRDLLQKQVLQRDNYKCVLCGSNKDLQVDHIQSWAEYIELRFSIDNCRTLCMDCHYLITFGKPKPEGIIWGHNLRKARVLT